MGLIGCVKAERVQFSVLLIPHAQSAALSTRLYLGRGVTGEPVSRGLLTAQKGGGGEVEGWGGAGKRLTASGPGAVLANIELRLIMA